MRLIDADELGASVIKNTVFDKGDVIKLIEDAPSIDIVRCRECKWNENTCINHGEMKPRCKFTDYVHTADDFCSYGCNSSEKPNNSERSSE